MTAQLEGWNKRNVRYEKVHDVDSRDLQKLVESLELCDGNTVVDMMCGYGAVTREISRYCSQNAMSVNPILIERYPEQLCRSYAELEGIDAARIVADVRRKCLVDDSVDRAVIKMGIHEVPKDDQQRVVDNAYACLKSGGILSLWDVMPYTEEEQVLFQDIIRKKDELAGFESLARDRYFFRFDEAMNYLVNAGFNNVEHVREIRYRFSTERRLHAEFCGNEATLNEFNEYVRGRVPEHLKEKLHYSDNGRTIEMTFVKGIVRGRK